MERVVLTWCYPRSLACLSKSRDGLLSRPSSRCWNGSTKLSGRLGRQAALVLVVDGRSPRLIWLDDVLGMLAAMTDDAAKKVLRTWQLMFN